MQVKKDMVWTALPPNTIKKYFTPILLGLRETNPHAIWNLILILCELSLYLSVSLNLSLANDYHLPFPKFLDQATQY